MTFASYYSKKTLNIREARHLAQRLGYPESLLVDLALKSADNYRPEKREPKKSGGFRITNEPKALLKAVQKKINRLLQEVKLPQNFFGSVKRKNHIMNAKEHVNQNFVACFDIRDYFPSIHDLFTSFNEVYFAGELGPVVVSWSSRMTLCAGLCYYSRQAKSCQIKLSQPILQYRPIEDLVDTLLASILSLHARSFILFLAFSLLFLIA